MGIVRRLIATEKTFPWHRAATYGSATILLALGELVLAAPQALPGLTVPGHQPHVTASLVLMRIRSRFGTDAVPSARAALAADLRSVRGPLTTRSDRSGGRGR